MSIFDKNLIQDESCIIQQKIIMDIEELFTTLNKTQSFAKNPSMFYTTSPVMVTSPNSIFYLDFKPWFENNDELKPSQNIK